MKIAKGLHRIGSDIVNSYLFVDADGVDLAPLTVVQTPGDDMFDSIEDLIPGSAKRLSRFLPRKTARPSEKAWPATTWGIFT